MADNPTTAERISDRELRVTRRLSAPVPRVFEAWSKAELFRQWWVPRSYGISLLSIVMDVRTGGSYRLEFPGHEGGEPMAFFGSYLDVVANERIVWTNEESADGPVTSVTFEDADGGTSVTIVDRYPSKEALDAELAGGAIGAMPETLSQLDEFLGGPAVE